MKLYTHGRTLAAQQARDAEAAARQKVAELDRLNAELDARIAARNEQMRKVPKVRTYAPTAEQVRAWEARAEAKKTALPEPLWGGQHNLYLASLEAATWDQTHRRRKRSA